MRVITAEMIRPFAGNLPEEISSNLCAARDLLHGAAVFAVRRYIFDSIIPRSCALLDYEFRFFFVVLRRASTDQSASKSNKEREDHVLTQLDQEADQEPVLSLPNGDGTFRGSFFIDNY